MVLLGVRYDNLTRGRALAEVLKMVQRDRKSQVFFLNLDGLCKAVHDPDYRRALRRARLVLPDGVGLRAATRLFGGRMRDNCNGTDFSPLLMERLAERGCRLYFLGGQEGVARSAAEAALKKIPSLRIVGTHSGYFAGEDVVQDINRSGADVLFVGLGVPLQEKWIFDHRDRLQPRLCLAVGALFDWMSGNMARSPLLLRRLGLEWLWRVFLEPRRLFRRYFIEDLPFLAALFFRRFRAG